MSEFKMIVGLGNPGKEYVDTRHNTGFKVIDLLARQFEIDVRRRKFGGRFGVGEFAGKKLILLKPLKFMNRSGHVAATAAGFYKLEISDLLVVTDDMALEPGRIRLRRKGSAGGHNGLADIVEKLGTEEFNRLRVGIGQSNEVDAIDYVLENPTEEQRQLLEEAIVRAKEAAVCWLENGIDAAMNAFND